MGRGNSISRASLAILLGLSQVLFCGPISSGAAGSTGATFLDIPVGARPAAMGSAYTALASDAYAPVWNPAGLGFVTSPELAGQHLSYLESFNYEYAGLAIPLKPGRTLGASMQYLGSGDINSTDPSGNSVGTYSGHYAAYSMAYGQKLNDQVSLGLTGKLIQAGIAGYTAQAEAFDFGTLYKPQDKLSLAATLTNVGNNLTFINEGDSLPMTVHLSGAYQMHSLLLTTEAVLPKDTAAGVRFGVEWTPMEYVSLRTGYRTDTTSQLGMLAGFSTGLGLHFWGQEFAYAWVPYGDLGDTQYFSLLFRFGNSETLKQNMQKAELIKTQKEIDKHSDVEYQQLMQLFGSDEPKMAQVPNTGEMVR